MEPYEILRQNMQSTIRKLAWSNEEVTVKARTLSAKEAIGEPEHQDYPIIKGRERMMAAEFRGCQGQAFTDHYGDYKGSLGQVANMELSDNFRRAVFLATFNAMLRFQGQAKGTVHCKDADPPLCAAELADMISQTYGKPKVALVGLQPRMAQALGARFELRVTDLDHDNIGQERFGITIEGEDATKDVLDWCDLALVTGTTFSNATISGMSCEKPVIFYGVTVAGAAAVMGLKRFCPYGS